MTKYKVLTPDVKGVALTIKGKKGLRTYRSKVVWGKILRGTKSEDKEMYRGQVGDKRGTTGIKVTLFKKFPDNLQPTLILDKDKGLPGKKTTEYYRKYYKL